MRIKIRLDTMSDINAFAANASPEALIQLYNDHFEGIIRPQWISEVTNAWRNDPLNSDGYALQTVNALMQVYEERIIGVPPVGASGAVYGI